MWILVLRIDLLVPGSRSLKDRRQAVKSLKERIRHRFDASCAEVGDLESWNRASLGVSCVSNEKQRLEGIADEISRYAQNDGNVLVSGVERDVFNYDESDGEDDDEDDEGDDDDLEDDDDKDDEGNEDECPKSTVAP